MKRVAFFSALISLSIAATSYAGSCPQFSPGGKQPVVSGKMSDKYRVLCSSGYAVGHSGLTRTPLWGAEHLTGRDIDKGAGYKRKNNFRADTRLPAGERSELTDYFRSEYDRGHVVNNRDLLPEQRDETFLLSNMVPQDSNNNRGLWSGIEGATRYEAKRRGEIYVVTGPIFQGSKTALRGRVLIPTGLYKCLYDPARSQAGCYVTSNAPGTQYNIASVSEVEASTGINLFPGVAANVKSQATRFVAPKLRKE